MSGESPSLVLLSGDDPLVGPSEKLEDGLGELLGGPLDAWKELLFEAEDNWLLSLEARLAEGFAGGLGHFRRTLYG
jgi:hypothetical protein